MAKLFTSKDDTPELSITISTQTFIKILLLIIGTIVVLGILRRSGHALLLIFSAFFLALALNAPVTWLSHHLPGRLRGRRALATSLSTLLVAILLIAFIASLVPPVVRQTSTLINKAPELVKNLHNSDSQVGSLINRYHLQSQVDKLSSQLSERLQHSGGSAVSTVGDVASSFFSVLTIVALTFMMLVEGPRWIAFANQLLPPRRKEYADRLTRDMYKVIKGYVNGQLLLAVVAACLLLPGLLFFHVSYPIALMAVVFLCGLIPMVGHTLGAIAVSLVALFHSPVSALGILLYYITYQQIENYLIQPRIQANATDMSPLLVFMSIVIGVSFAGLIGGIVAIPIAGCIRVWLIDYLQSRDLINKPPRPQAGYSK